MPRARSRVAGSSSRAAWPARCSSVMLAAAYTRPDHARCAVSICARRVKRSGGQASAPSRPRVLSSSMETQQPAGCTTASCCASISVSLSARNVYGCGAAAFREFWPCSSVLRSILSLEDGRSCNETARSPEQCDHAASIAIETAPSHGSEGGETRDFRTFLATAPSSKSGPTMGTTASPRKSLLSADGDRESQRPSDKRGGNGRCPVR